MIHIFLRCRSSIMTVYYGHWCEEKTGRVEFVVGLSVGTVSGLVAIFLLIVCCKRLSTDHRYPSFFQNPLHYRLHIQCLMMEKKAKIFLTELKKRHLFSRYLSKSHEVEADDFISNELNSDLDYNYFSHYNPCWYSDAAGFSNQVH